MAESIDERMQKEFRALTDQREKESTDYLKSRGWIKAAETPFTNFWKDPDDGQNKKTDYAVFLQKRRDENLGI